MKIEITRATKTLNLPYHTHALTHKERVRELVGSARGDGREVRIRLRDREIFWVRKLGIFFFFFKSGLRDWVLWVGLTELNQGILDISHRFR